MSPSEIDPAGAGRLKVGQQAYPVAGMGCWNGDSEGDSVNVGMVSVGDV
jgi:hypothetical protein